jgi:acyl-CoA thioesterase-1
MAAALVLSAACGTREAPGDARQTAAPGPPAADAAPPPASAVPRIVILGDSLTAGLGLSPDQSYPALLQERVRQAGFDYDVVNAGVSGDTSAGGLRRLEWALDGDVRVLVVALGGNDGLRGLPPSELRKNLSEIIERAKTRHISVVIAGMEAPPNFGHQYTVEFRQVFPEVAKAHGAVLLPFLLDGVAGVDGLNQRDGIHPTAEGARRVADNVWAVLRPLLEGRSGRT